mmetsp:Transcript_29229/g.62158  ORF Transcript_29229/g.62158 Transcript_29229/m.62158 type:complete len:221 (+) Transcript_29229:249-911(+)|eukprot:CAMPEP_0172316854 /NCGR_PEP_ID=MMETSP1058-20130122/29768_1 /TAXON_ID=83371 /ORGANISM="Detonula confervacea, Strain CCMP 353" /LENGTH=220 /DNA_ID=CAMNT_0013031281 /DNA_START=195 /DNA_END=857 /DNA_ORIENTATION=+
MPLEGRRDRSYSDAHALIYSSKVNSSHNSPKDTMGAEITNKANAPTSPKMMACTKKHQSSRPRSKSLDLHRHSTPIHKKKYPQHHKHIPRTFSPGGHHHGRISPSSPKLEGRLWIRPAATRSQMPSFPALASRVAPYPSSTEQQEIKDGGFANMTSLNDSKQARQVTDGSSSSPTSFNDDMWLYTSPNSSFDSYQRQGLGPARIIFGESGKPIKPRADCF